jgi:hypothetical protein
MIDDRADHHEVDHRGFESPAERNCVILETDRGRAPSVVIEPDRR